MGFKRPLDDEKFHELPLKHSRQLGYTDKSNQFDKFSPRHDVFHKPVAAVNERNLCKSQGAESSDGEMFDVESNLVYTGHDMDGTSTWVTKGCGGRDATHSSYSVNYFELGMPLRVFAPVETFYSFLLDQPARKQVPIGPGHQAQIPEWEGRQNENVDPSGMTAQNHVVEFDDSDKLYSTCVGPVPALNTLAQMDDIVGKARKYCVCKDRGSIRCVCQHIIEAREEIVKILGFETFKDLGFCDMGEEVARNWSEEDEQLFHEVVYSNPVTLGRNFWKHLETAFCSRSKKEIVSYYFNVFVLRRRAIQNRTLLLDIDSDDDEWHGCYGDSSGTHYVEEDEEDSAIESPLHQEAEKVSPFHQEEGEIDASNNGKDEYNICLDTRECGSGLFDQHKIYSTIEYKNRFSGRNGERLNVEDMARFSGKNEERLNVEDDSCTSFEPAHDAVYCIKKNEMGIGEHQKKLKECNGPMDTKVWDASRCLNVSTKP